MTKKFSLFIALIGFNLISCQTPEEPRKPISQQSGSYMKESSERNKIIAQKEKEAILSIIENDSLTYEQSDNGFWYAYLSQNKEDTITPQKGDQVIFTYNISDLSGNEIYSKEELGEKEYFIDEEVIFSGLRQGLKLMKEGEKVYFIFQSFKAFGATGDRDRIPTNTPITAKVELLEINQK